MLLGVRAVLAESYERIHRANLVGMGILPLELPAGETVESLGLSGHETFDITGLEGAGSDGFPREVTVRADDKELTCRVRIDTPNEVEHPPRRHPPVRPPPAPRLTGMGRRDRGLGQREYRGHPPRSAGLVVTVRRASSPRWPFRSPSPFLPAEPSSGWSA